MKRGSPERGPPGSPARLLLAPKAAAPVLRAGPPSPRRPGSRRLPGSRATAQKPVGLQGDPKYPSRHACARCPRFGAASQCARRCAPAPRPRRAAPRPCSPRCLPGASEPRSSMPSRPAAGPGLAAEPRRGRTAGAGREAGYMGAGRGGAAGGGGRGVSAFRRRPGGKAARAAQPWREERGAAGPDRAGRPPALRPTSWPRPSRGPGARAAPPPSRRLLARVAWAAYRGLHAGRAPGSRSAAGLGRGGREGGGDADTASRRLPGPRTPHLPDPGPLPAPPAPGPSALGRAAATPVRGVPAAACGRHG